MPKLSDFNPSDDNLRPHSYDGIQEFDNRLPNWWLFTLYIAIAFSIVYWFYYHLSGVGMNEHERLDLAMAQVEEARLAASIGDLDDARLWSMAQNSEMVEAGRAVFETNCVACHLSSMRGKEENPAAIGPSLVDNEWIHGGTPMEVNRVITHGVIEKGMLAWEPILGDRKVAEVTAYIMSHHAAPAAAGAN